MRTLRGLFFFCLAVSFVGTAHAANGSEMTAIPIERAQGVVLVADTAIPAPLPWMKTAGFQTMGAGSANVSNGPFYTEGVLLVRKGDSWDSREVTFIGNLRGVIYRRLYLGDGQIWKQQATVFQIPAENTWWQVWTGSVQNLPDGPVWFEINIDGRSLYIEIRNPNVSPLIRMGKSFYTNGYIDITGVFVQNMSNPSLPPPALPINALLVGGSRMESYVRKIDQNNIFLFLGNKQMADFGDGEYPVAICSFGVCVSDYHGFTMLSDQQQSVAKGSIAPTNQ